MNVRLWASIEVTIGNPARIGRLSDQQRGWLKQAASDAEAYAASLVMNESDSIRGACDQGARLVTATADQLAALRTAFDPLYTELRSQPETNRAIDEIQKLASTVAPEPAPDLPSTCVGRR